MTIEKNILNSESDWEDQINQNLNKYEKYIKSIFKEKNYSEIISRGTDIISLMLKTVLKKENISDSCRTSVIKTANPTTFPEKPKISFSKLTGHQKKSTKEIQATNIPINF